MEEKTCSWTRHVALMAERCSRYGSRKLLIAVLALCLYAITYRKNEVRDDFQVIGLFSTFYSKHFCSARLQVHGRGNSYLKSRVLQTANGTSSFQFDRIALCDVVHPQPEPAVKVKYPCKECQRNVRSNHNATCVLIAKPGRMQNVSDLPIHNSNTTGQSAYRLDL